MARRDNPVHNGIYEKLWYVVLEAIGAGISPTDFRLELVECWVEAHKDAARFSKDALLRDLHDH